MCFEADRPVARSFYDWMEIDRRARLSHGLRTFRVSPRSFFQVNRFLIEPAGGTRTSGSQLGNPRSISTLAWACSLFRSPGDSNRSRPSKPGSGAIRDLEVNAERAGLAVQREHKRVEDFLSALKSTPNFVLADPPRAGLEKSVVANLNRLASPRITIVSCDPATLARDLAALTNIGSND